MGLGRGIGARGMLFVAVLALAACATTADPPPTLYKQLGGREGIALVVGDFVTNMAGDSRVNARRSSSLRFCKAALRSLAVSAPELAVKFARSAAPI